MNIVSKSPLLILQVYNKYITKRISSEIVLAYETVSVTTLKIL